MNDQLVGPFSRLDLHQQRTLLTMLFDSTERAIVATHAVLDLAIFTCSSFRTIAARAGAKLLMGELTELKLQLDNLKRTSPQVLEPSAGTELMSIHRQILRIDIEMKRLRSL